MRQWFWWLAGGMCGTAGQRVLAGAVYQWLGTAFPYGALVVNVSGCLVIGFLGTLADHKFLLGPEARLFWTVGLSGS